MQILNFGNSKKKTISDFYKNAPKKFNEKDFLEAVKLTYFISINFNNLINKKKTKLPNGKEVLLVLGFDIKDSDWEKAVTIFNSVLDARKAEFDIIRKQIEQSR